MLSNIEQNIILNLSIDKSNNLINKDLKVVSTSTFGKIFWHIACHFVWMQKLFYGLNLADSQKKLQSIRAKVSPQDAATLKTFNLACQRFNKIAPAKFQVSPINSVQAKITNKPTQAKVTKKISLLTYNILFPQKKDQHTSPFSTSIGYSEKNGEVYPNDNFRFKIILKNLRNANSDINCLQEVTKDVFNKLQAELSKKGYKGEFVSHNTFHGVAIFYKDDRFNKLGSNLANSNNYFSMQVEGKNGKPFQKQRFHLILDLQDKTTSKVVRVATAHFFDPSDFEDKSGHVRAVMEATETKTNYEIDKVVIAGDFNQDQWGDKVKGKKRTGMPSLQRATALQPLFQNGFKVSNNLDPSEYKRSNKDYFNSSVTEKKRKIDHIFVKNKNQKADAPEEVPFKAFDRRGSDHRAVLNLI